MPKKLLLAEDSATVQKVFELALEKSGILVIPVDNGEDAVRQAAEIAPDLVIADVTLPGKDGFEVASAIRDGEATKGLPVLILSGTLVPIDEEKLRACGAKGVLFKPFETMELLEKLESLLGERAEAPVAEMPQAVEVSPVAETPPESPPPSDEHWDFSDVLDEAEEPVQAVKPDAAARPAGDLLGGEFLKGPAREEAAGYDEFDVSLEEIEERPAAPAAPVEAVLPAREALSPPTAKEPEPEPVEEIEDLEDLEDVLEPLEAAAPPERVEIPEEMEEGDRVAAPVPAARFAAPPPAQDEDVLTAELKEQFIARAEVIFRDVAAETVEKVMWEMMGRLTEEFSAKIRESVEAVAWEVIPATAEALIREEITRIRSQAGKPKTS